MRFVPTYEVHVADLLGFDQSPFIITTVYTDLEGYPNTLPSDENLLVTFRLRGMYAGCLESIRQKTECKPLADFIEWVLELPTLNSENL